MELLRILLGKYNTASGIGVLALVSCLMLSQVESHAQGIDLPIGAYGSSEDFWNRKLLYEGSFDLQKTNHRKIPELYTHKVHFVTSNETGIWAIYDGTDLFLNIRRLGIYNGFVRIPAPRMYNHFVAMPTTRLEKFNAGAIAESTVAYMATGMAGMAARGDLSNSDSKRVNYLFHLDNGKVYPLSEYYMMRVLEPYPRLYNAYRIDSERGDINIMLLYIEALNDAIEYGQ